MWSICAQINTPCGLVVHEGVMSVADYETLLLSYFEHDMIWRNPENIDMFILAAVKWLQYEGFKTASSGIAMNILTEMIGAAEEVLGRKTPRMCGPDNDDEAWIEGVTKFQQRLANQVPHCKPAFRHIFHIFENGYFGRILVGEGEKIRTALHTGLNQAHRNLEMCNETPSPGLPAERPQCRWIHHYFCPRSSSEWCTTLPSVIPISILQQVSQDAGTVTEMPEDRLGTRILAAATHWLLRLLKRVHGGPTPQLATLNGQFSTVIQTGPIDPLPGPSVPLTPPLSMPVAQVPYFTTPSPTTALTIPQIPDVVPAVNPNIGWRNVN